MKILEAMEILKLNNGFTKEELKHAYRTQLKIYHPDVNSNNYSEEKVRIIYEANTILKKFLEDKSSNSDFDIKKSNKIKEIKNIINNFSSKENMFNKRFSVMFETIKSSERQLYDRYINDIEKCNDQQTFNSTILNYTAEFRLIFNNLINSLYDIYKPKFQMLEFYLDLTVDYYLIKNECLSCSTAEEILSKFKECVIKISNKNDELIKNEEIKFGSVFEYNTLCYINSEFYPTLQNKIEKIKQKFVSECMNYRISKEYFKNKPLRLDTINNIIKSYLVEVDIIFKNYSIFNSYKKSKINELKDINFDLSIKSYTQEFSNLLDKISKDLSFITEKLEFDSEYEACIKLLYKKANELKYNEKKQLKENDINEIKNELLNKFHLVTNKSSKDIIHNSQVLTKIINYLDFCLKGILDDSMIKYFRYITFTDFEFDNDILNLVYNKASSNVEILDINKNKSNNTIIKMSKDIRPVVEKEEKKYVLDQVSSLYNIFISSFLDDFESKSYKEIDLKKKSLCGIIKCYFEIGYDDTFKPKESEVLKQLPENIGVIKEYEVIEPPKLVQNSDGKLYYESKVKLYK